MTYDPEMNALSRLKMALGLKPGTRVGIYGYKGTAKDLKDKIAFCRRFNLPKII